MPDDDKYAYAFGGMQLKDWVEKVYRSKADVLRRSKMWVCENRLSAIREKKLFVLGSLKNGLILYEDFELRRSKQQHPYAYHSIRHGHGRPKM